MVLSRGWLGQFVWKRCERSVPQIGNTPSAVGVQDPSEEPLQTLFITELNSPFSEIAEFKIHLSQTYKCVYMYTEDVKLVIGQQ